MNLLMYCTFTCMYIVFITLILMMHAEGQLKSVNVHINIDVVTQTAVVAQIVNLLIPSFIKQFILMSCLQNSFSSQRLYIHIG